MDIKIKVLKENQKERTAARKKKDVNEGVFMIALGGIVANLLGKYGAFALLSAIDKVAGTELVKNTPSGTIQMIDNQFKAGGFEVKDQFSDRIKPDPGMGSGAALEKFRQLQKDKKLNESLVDILSDPGAMVALAAALGVGVVALKSVLSGGGDDSSLNRVRAKIKANIAHADELSKDSREKREREKKNRMVKLQQMKADRGENPEGQIPLELTDGESSPASDYDSMPDRDVKRFVLAKRLAEHPSTDEGTASSAEAHMERLRAKYPGIDDHPSVIEDLYEIFKRFL